MGVSGKILKHYLTILILFLSPAVFGQRLFDSVQVEKALLTYTSQASENEVNENIVRAIETVDKYYRQIADTLYYYKSLKHTIFQNVLIETNDSIFINPLSLGNKIHLSNIVFNNNALNSKVDSISKGLEQAERKKLYKYLSVYFDNFSQINNKLNAQPVRLKYVKFPDNQYVHIGIDIYGSHFLWTVDRNKNWDIVKVENLWSY